MSASNEIIKNVLNNIIQLRLWCDTGVDKYNQSELQTHS